MFKIVHLVDDAIQRGHVADCKKLEIVLQQLAVAQRNVDQLMLEIRRHIASSKVVFPFQLALKGVKPIFRRLMRFDD